MKKDIVQAHYVRSRDRAATHCSSPRHHSDLVYVVCPIGVYQTSVESSVLAHVEAPWESPEMLGELCTELGFISQPVAEITTHVEFN